MSDTLNQICDTKREHIIARKAKISITEISDMIAQQSAPRGFIQSIEQKSHDGFALIAEIKKASPSKGLIRENFDPSSHAKAYEDGGAACLSILTDTPYFQGKDDYLVSARAAATLPCLRKDFMVDPWQVVESRSLGADAILIIMAALDDYMAADIEDAALSYGMDALIEVHDEKELERALKLKSKLLGINNRNLKTFETSLSMTEKLSDLLPDDRIMVSESGISTHEDCVRLSAFGARCFLVGESLMRQEDVSKATRALLSGL